MASLSLKHINKTYPNGFEAVKDFNLEIESQKTEISQWYSRTMLCTHI